MRRSYTNWTEPTALSLNASGRLTAEQSAQVETTTRVSDFPWWLAAMLMLLSSLPLWWPEEPRLWSTRQGLIPTLFFLVFTVFIGLNVGLVKLRQRRLKAQTHADLADLNVATANGQVTWGRTQYHYRGYVARIGQRKLRVADGQLNLIPGPYRFYYLATSGWLLSAQPVDLPTSSARSDDYVRCLARQHGFTLTDLEHNRRGRLSGVQRLRDMSLMLGAWLLAGPLLIGAGLWLFGLNPTAAPSGIAVSLLLIGLGLAAIDITRRRGSSALAGRVTQAEGRLSIRYETAGRSTIVYYGVGSYDLKLSWAQMLRMAYVAAVDGQRHRIYFLPGELRLVSLEPID